MQQPERAAAAITSERKTLGLNSGISQNTREIPNIPIAYKHSKRSNRARGRLCFLAHKQTHTVQARAASPLLPAGMCSNFPFYYCLQHPKPNSVTSQSFTSTFRQHSKRIFIRYNYSYVNHIQQIISKHFVSLFKQQNEFLQ